MKIHPDCYPCLIRQMEAAARAAGADGDMIHSVREATKESLRELWDDEASPPAVSAPLYRMTGEMCGSRDPYRAQKVRYTLEALELLPELFRIVESAEDPFEAAVRISIAGNVIDFGTGGDGEIGDLSQTLGAFLTRPFFRSDIPDLSRRVPEAKWILYLGDNAGETVFDRPLLSLLPSGKTVYAAKAGPIINDATVEDARLAGIHLHAELVDTGSRIPGTISDLCSPRFRKRMEEADLIIAKGQGNFETLTEEPSDGRIFMLFTVKCSVAASSLGARMGDMVAMRW